jgi:hypothetical protein
VVTALLVCPSNTAKTRRLVGRDPSNPAARSSWAEGGRTGAEGDHNGVVLLGVAAPVVLLVVPAPVVLLVDLLEPQAANTMAPMPIAARH